MLDMKLTKNNLIKKLGESNSEVIEIVTKYNKLLPILSEDGEGFCVSAKDLHKQLQVGRDYTTWIKDRIKKYDFISNEDYIEYWVKDGIIFDDTQMGDVKLDITNSNQMVRNGYSKEYKLTIDCAKQLCMVQNNNLGKITRKYFIYVERLLKKAIEWDLIRKPERIRYKELCEELKKYYIRNKGREPEWYVYSNEADALNKICLGAKSKDIREYIEACDKNTREWLEAEYNTYLDELQKMDLMYLRMNFDKDKRYDLIKQGFKALYPNASFIVANKEKYLN